MTLMNTGICYAMVDSRRFAMVRNSTEIYHSKIKELER